MPRLAELLLTELWHLLDVSAIAGHGAVFAAFLFMFHKILMFLYPTYVFTSTQFDQDILIWCFIWGKEKDAKGCKCLIAS